jgi:hypothetical protein
VDAPTPGPLKVGDLERGTFAPPLTKAAVQPIAWSSDGTRITYRTADGAIAWRRADGAGPEERLADPQAGLDCSAAVYVQAFPGTGAVKRISPEIGRRPAWRGNELFYLTPRGLKIAAVRTQPTFDFDPPRYLFEDFNAYDGAGTGGLTFEVSPDGRRFLVLKGQSGGGDFISKLTVVLHWVEDVKRKLAAR